MIEAVPKLYIFAGPNGSGKSTLTEKLYTDTDELPQLYINADEIKKKYNLTDLEAAQEADRQRKEALAQGESFTMETVMSMPDKIDLMKDAKARGYEIHFFYVTTQDPRINVDRILYRHEEGGHFVPPDKVKARYKRSMKLLPQALQIVDTAKIFNNSFESPRLIIEKSKELGIVVHPQEPPSIWTKERIENFIGVSVANKSTKFKVKKVPDIVEIQKYPTKSHEF